MTAIPRKPGYYAAVRGDAAGLTPAVYRYGPRKTTSETRLEAWENGAGAAITEVVWEGEAVELDRSSFSGDPDPMYRRCMLLARAKVIEFSERDPHGAGI